MYAIVENNEVKQIITNPKSLVIGDVRYPAKIFELWSKDEKEAIGIYEIVVEIAKHFNLPLQNIQRISSKILAQKAKRPKFTGLELTKAKKKFNYSPKTLKESLSIIENQIKINK